MHALILFAELLCTGLNPHSLRLDRVPQQSYHVYRDGDTYVVRGQVDTDVYARTQTADAAVNRAVELLGDSGGEIALQNGEFILQNEIRLRSRVVLSGKGDATVLRIAAAHATGIGISVRGQNRVRVQNVAIKATEGTRNARIGVLIRDSGECSVQSLFIANMTEFGIRVDSASFLSDVTGCRIGNSGQAGISLHDLAGGGRGGDFLPNTLADNVIYRGGRGVDCYQAIVVNMVNNVVFQTRDNAFLVKSNSNSITLTGNRTFQIETDAVVIDGSYEINLTGNIFCWSVGRGIVLRDVAWGTVTGNNIIDNGSLNIFDKSSRVVRRHPVQLLAKPTAQQLTYQRNGIVLEHSRGLTVSANAIFNWSVCPPMKHGISEDERSAHNLFTGNTINYYTGAAIISKGRQSRVANNHGFASVPFYDEGRDGQRLENTGQSQHPNLGCGRPDSVQTRTDVPGTVTPQKRGQHHQLSHVRGLRVGESAYSAGVNPLQQQQWLDADFGGFQHLVIPVAHQSQPHRQPRLLRRRKSVFQQQQYAWR